MKRITISDVAKEAGVSTATVSRVLNNKQGEIKISELTFLKVQKAAEKLGYAADPFAASLRSKRSGLFGVVMRDVRDRFLLKLFLALDDEAKEHDVQLLLANADYSLAAAEQQVQMMRRRWFDATFVLGDIPGDGGLLNADDDGQVRVAIACGKRKDVPSITIDEKEGVRLGMQHLIDLGHRKIACVGDGNALGVKERMQEFVVLAQEFDLDFRDEFVRNSENCRRSGAEQASVLMEMEDAPTAIFCLTDTLAFGAIDELHRLGLDVPKDVSVVGFDDVLEAVEIYPALTTVRQPVKEMAKVAFKEAMALLDDESIEQYEAVHLVPDLVVRETTAAINFKK